MGILDIAWLPKIESLKLGQELVFCKRCTKHLLTRDARTSRKSDNYESYDTADF